MVGLVDLPNELLGLIFEHLYLVNREVRLPLFWEFFAHGNPQEVEYVDWVSDDLTDPNIFPWVVAQVCQQWQQAASRFPHFWSRLVFDIAHNACLPANAFEWSKNYFFRALIMDSRLVHPVNGALEHTADTAQSAILERCRVEAITEALIPHLARCVSLQYDVRFASSLPRLCTLLPHTRIDINQVELKYTTPNYGPNFLLHSNIPLLKPIRFAPFCSISCLSLPVADFMSAGRNIPGFWTCQHSITLFSIELQHYEFYATELGLFDGVASVGEFLFHLTSLKSITSLTLRHLSVRPPPDEHMGPPITTGYTIDPSWDVSEFFFENLSRKFLKLFLEHVNFFTDCGYIKNCKLPSNANRASAADLTFIDLPIDAHLFHAMSQFGGCQLTFESCQYLDDDDLGLLVTANLEYFNELTFINCNGYSIQGLMELVMKAGCGSKNEEGLNSLAIRGTSPKPPKETREWFSSHLKKFECD